jgi:hypothetical protein
MVPGMFLLAKIPASLDEFHDVTVGSGRLQAQVWSDAEGAIDSSSFTMTDTMLKQDCTFVSATDGTQRCFPAWITGGEYSDMSCKTPAACPFPPTAAPEALYAATWIGDPCTRGLEFHGLGPALTSQGVFHFDGGVCVGSTMITYPCYSIGPVVPSSTFAEGKLVVD